MLVFGFFGYERQFYCKVGQDFAVVTGLLLQVVPSLSPNLLDLASKPKTQHALTQFEYLSYIFDKVKHFIPSTLKVINPANEQKRILYRYTYYRHLRTKHSAKG